jgi:hypothetical protein
MLRLEPCSYTGMADLKGDDVELVSEKDLLSGVQHVKQHCINQYVETSPP